MTNEMLAKQQRKKRGKRRYEQIEQSVKSDTDSETDSEDMKNMRNKLKQKKTRGSEDTSTTISAIQQQIQEIRQLIKAPLPVSQHQQRDEQATWQTLTPTTLSNLLDDKLTAIVTSVLQTTTKQQHQQTQSAATDEPQEVTDETEGENARTKPNTDSQGQSVPGTRSPVKQHYGFCEQQKQQR